MQISAIMDTVLLDESLSSASHEGGFSTGIASPTVPGSTVTSPVSYSSASPYTRSPARRLSPRVQTSGAQSAITTSYVSSDGRPVAFSPKQQTELLLAKSKITYLETELITLRRAAKRARIEEEGREADKTKSTSLNAERVHMVGGRQFFNPLAPMHPVCIMSRRNVCNQTS